MSAIRILSDEVANRIAAGEVIERPASVVKELVENALDAGAHRVVVRTEHGGQRLVQVIDDGCGMDRDDAMLCIEPHATSKIREAADIERISTLGFRGEALPSIAAVSRFQLQTRRPDEETGTELEIEGGTLRDVRDCGCAPGTNVRVRQLFHNLPARRKFLRSAATEEAHIQEALLLQALAHPGVAFELAMDSRLAIQVGAHEGVGPRLAMLLGRDTFRALLPVEYEEAGLRVTGFVARPGLTRGTRAEQRLFVNGRPAAADCVYFGIRDAYHTLVMKGRYPPVVLYLTLPPDRVDVNVHPAKREVRFRDDRLTGQIVAAAVRKALRDGAVELTPPAEWPRPPAAAASAPAPGPAVPAVPLPPPVQPQFPLRAAAWPPPRPARPEPLAAEPVGDGPPATTVGPDPDPQTAAAAVAPQTEPRAEPPSDVAPASVARGTSPSVSTRSEIRGLRVLGCIRDLYLVAEGPSGLVLIDQHAAHERVLFERLLAASRARDGEQQPLLMTVTVDLPPSDAALLERSLEHFGRLGFAIEPFGGHTFLVTAVPPHFPQEDIGGLLRDILDDLRESPGAVGRPDEVRVAQAACKHAVRAEDPLAPGEVERLLADLAETEMPYTCPHGRPVMVNLPYEDLEKRFGRRV